MVAPTAGIGYFGRVGLAPVTEEENGMSATKERRQELLRWLSVGCYVVAGVAALCSCIVLKVFVDGILIMFCGHDMLGRRIGGDMSGATGLFLALVGGLLVAAGWIAGYFLFMAGRRLSRRYIEGNEKTKK
jgi:hypothetical protein